MVNNSFNINWTKQSALSLNNRTPPLPLPKEKNKTNKQTKNDIWHLKSSFWQRIVILSGFLHHLSRPPWYSWNIFKFAINMQSHNPSANLAMLTLRNTHRFFVCSLISVRLWCSPIVSFGVLVNMFWGVWSLFSKVLLFYITSKWRTVSLWTTKHQSTGIWSCTF
jgi:hypothetical protein